jgi:HSP20 family molecular chaperone IbpA|tara:strand:- start:903 stop:1331 length:429 start_codon:yes stop_codon:yes gene_type:complete
MSTALASYRPSLLGSRVFDDVFNNFFSDFPVHLQRSTSGYPVADIYRNEDGSTVMEFALAGFTKEDLSVDVRPDKRSITVSAQAQLSGEDVRRIARRSFAKTYVNYDDNLDLTQVCAKFDNGLLSVTVPPRPDVQPLSVAIG